MVSSGMSCEFLPAHELLMEISLRSCVVSRNVVMYEHVAMYEHVVIYMYLVHVFLTPRQFCKFMNLWLGISDNNFVTIRGALAKWLAVRAVTTGRGFETHQGRKGLVHFPRKSTTPLPNGDPWSTIPKAQLPGVSRVVWLFVVNQACHFETTKLFTRSCTEGHRKQLLFSFLLISSLPSTCELGEVLAKLLCN